MENNVKGNIFFQVKSLKAKDGDVIIIRVPNMDDISERLQQNLYIKLKDVFPNNKIIMLEDKYDINILPESTLNAMGLFKIGEEDSREVKGSISIDEEIERIEIKNYVAEKTQRFAKALLRELKTELPDTKLDVRVRTIVKKE